MQEASTPHPSSDTHSKHSRGRLRLILILLVVVGIGGLSGWYYWFLHDVSSLEAVERQINRHYTLPENEMPVMATVTDSTQLTTPFLQQAHNGDKILFYQKNQVALIYRPSIDRLVAVGPLVISQADTSTTK